MSSFAKFAALPADWHELSPGTADGTSQSGERLEVTFRFVYTPDSSDRKTARAEKPREIETKNPSRPITVNLPVEVLVSPADRAQPKSNPAPESSPRPVLFRGVVLALILEAAIGLSGWASIHEFARLLHR